MRVAPQVASPAWPLKPIPSRRVRPTPRCCRPISCSRPMRAKAHSARRRKAVGVGGARTATSEHTSQSTPRQARAQVVSIKKKRAPQDRFVPIPSNSYACDRTVVPNRPNKSPKSKRRHASRPEPRAVARRASDRSVDAPRLHCTMRSRRLTGAFHGFTRPSC